MGRVSLLVLDSIPVILIVSTLLAFLAGLGVGGGSLLILWLTVILNYPQEQARVLNLLFFLPCAIIATLFRWKQGYLDIKKILPAVIAGCLVAGVCSWFSRSLDISILKKLFGGLLIFTGIRELLYKKKSKEHP